MTEPFNFPDGRVANDAKDLLELCEQYPDDATGFLVRQDLEKWLAYIGNYNFAECATNARQTDMDDRQKLEEFLSRCHSVTVADAVPKAQPETAIADNMTAPESGAVITEVPEAPNETPADKSLSEAVPPKTQPVVSSSPESHEKLSFFQVVAKFIVKILYRNKA